MLEAAISGERMLTGPEKAAALLLMMGKPPAARLLKQFDQPDLQAVARAAAGLGAISATTLDRLVDEFATDFSAGADLFSDAGQVKNLLADSLPPEQIADILGVESGETKEVDVWRALAQAPEAAILALLMAERATTATYILSKLDSAVATKVIAALPRDRRNAALCGLVAPLAVTPLAARLIEEAVGSALKQAPKAAADVEGRSRLAGIINGLDPPEAEDAMRALEQASPKDAAIVKDDALFVQRSAATVRTRSGFVVRPRLDRHCRHGAQGDGRGLPRHGPVVHAVARTSSGRRRAQFRRECAASGHRQGAQGHRRHRARHGEPQ